ncbi:hypothetical protein V6N13_122560 [Hibiscus sabdariffa]
MGGYVKNGPVGIARELFNEMPEKDTFSWNMSMTIAGTWVLGKWRRRESCLKKLPFRDVMSWNSMDGIKCDGFLSTALLTMYANCGAMDLARDVFDNMPDKNEV